MDRSHELQAISKEELIKIIQQKNTLLFEQAKQIQFLEEQILAYRLRQFANKSEKLILMNISLFDEAVLPKSEEKILSQEEVITVASYTKSKQVGEKSTTCKYFVYLEYDLSKMKKFVNAVVH